LDCSNSILTLFIIDKYVFNKNNPRFPLLSIYTYEVYYN
jgi:hypothetical protein